MSKMHILLTAILIFISNLLSGQCAEIYFYRMNSLLDSGEPYLLIQDGVQIATVRMGDRYKATVCSPGDYELIIKENWEILVQAKENIHVQPGGEYYVKITSVIGVPSMTQVDAGKGKSDLSKGGKYKGAMQPIQLQNAPVTASSSSGPTGTNGTSSPQAGTFQKTQTVQNFKFDIVNMVRAGDMLELDYKITNLQSDDRVLFMSGLSTYFYDDLGNLYNANEYCLVSDCDGMRTADKVDSYVLNGEYRDFSRAEANIPSQIPINAKVIIRGIKNDATKLVRGTMVFRAKSGNAYSDFQLAYQNIPLKIEDKSSNPNEKVVGNQSYQLLGVQSKDNYQVIKFNFTNSASEVYSYRISGITIYDNIGNAYNSAGITFGQSNEFQSGYYSQYQQDLAPNSTMGTNIWIADVSPQATMFKRVDIEFEKYKLSWENIPIQGGSSSTGGSSGSMSSKSIATSNRNSNYLDYSDFETKVREKVDVTGKRVILEKIYFATGSDQLLSDSYPQLDDLAELLSLNPNLDVEVSGHTDNVGDAVSNMLLSQKRADAIKYYLIAKAIDPARVSSIGRGENEPVMSNDSEGGRKENRRVEIKVVN